MISLIPPWQRKASLIKAGVALFPGNFVYDAPIQGYIVTKQDDPKVEEAAIEMVKFFTSAEAQQTAMEMQAWFRPPTR